MGQSPAYRVLHAEPTPHHCTLPSGDKNWAENSVLECSVCGQKWVARWPYDYWGAPSWVPLRWWHRAAHRLLQREQMKTDG